MNFISCRNSTIGQKKRRHKYVIIWCFYYHKKTGNLRFFRFTLPLQKSTDSSISVVKRLHSHHILQRFAAKKPLRILTLYCCRGRRKVSCTWGFLSMGCIEHYCRYKQRRAALGLALRCLPVPLRHVIFMLSARYCAPPCFAFSPRTYGRLHWLWLLGMSCSPARTENCLSKCSEAAALSPAFSPWRC